MYSKARIAGHPIHPMVIVFPVAFYVATVAALLAHVGTGDAFYYRAAMVANLAGVAMALAAAIPGAIDLLALPRGSRARQRAARHGTAALGVTAMFAASGALLYRGWTARVMVDGRWDLDATVPLAIGVLGVVMLVGATTLGWALVQTHHLGIKPARTRADRPSRDPELDELLEPLPRPAPARQGRGTTGQLSPLGS